MDKKEVITLSIIKSVITTAIIGAAVYELFKLLSIGEIIYQEIAFLAIGIICLLGASFYLHKLLLEGKLLSKINLLHLPGLSWETNVGYLLESWFLSGEIAVEICLSLALMLYNPELGICVLIVGIGGALLCIYIMRGLCKTTSNYVKYFLIGYALGAALVFSGVLVGFLVSTFSPIWVYGLLLVEVLFAGMYTYLDLLDWKNEEEKKVVEKVLKDSVLETSP